MQSGTDCRSMFFLWVFRLTSNSYDCHILCWSRQTVVRCKRKKRYCETGYFWQGWYFCNFVGHCYDGENVIPEILRNSWIIYIIHIHLKSDREHWKQLKSSFFLILKIKSRKITSSMVLYSFKMKSYSINSKKSFQKHDYWVLMLGVDIVWVYVEFSYVCNNHSI